MHHSALRTFRQMDVSTLECFDMGTFRHGEFSALHLVIWQIHLCSCKSFAKIVPIPKNYILAPVLLCRNVHLPKCPRAEMFLCQKFLVPKIPCAENFSCRKILVPKNVPVLKRPSAGMRAASNGARAEMFSWWNICAEMTLVEMLCAEMVYRPKWQLECYDNTLGKSSNCQLGCIKTILWSMQNSIGT